METNFNTDNFEQMLREATDDFRMYPSKRVWHGIYNDLHPAKKWPSFAVLLLLVTSIMYIGVTNPDKGGQALAEISSDPNDKPVQVGSPELKNEQTTNTSELTAYPTRNNVNTTNSDVSVPTARPRKQAELYVASLQSNSAVISQNDVPFKPQLSVAKTIPYVTQGEQFENTVLKSNEINAIQNQTGIPEVPARGSLKDSETYLTAPVLSTSTGTVLNTLSPETQNELSITKPPTATNISSTVLDASLRSNNLDESGWMEDYAFRNMKSRDNWKGRMSYQVYVTPSLGYRTLNKTRDYSLPPTNALVANPNAPTTTNYTLNHASDINLELGAGIIYSASKMLRLKAGVQLNYTNYSVNAQELNHPTFTALMLTNTFTNAPVLSTRTTTIANTTGAASRYLNNTTYQISIPVGADVKLGGSERLKVYLGGTLQPTYILGGESYLVSADMKNYVADESFLRKINLNGAIEAFVTYKTQNGVTLIAGPQFRYQFFSTYNNMYTYDEKLYNLGVKLGMTKNF